jgi:threonine dehydrogenase-like Zn-dependent dehydrogenase
LPAPQGHDVRARISFAAVKHGTESHHVSGSVFDSKRWDPELRLFLPGEAPANAERAPAPVARCIGNTVVGEVVAVGAEVNRFAVGDRVFGYGPVQEERQLHERDWRPLGDLSPESAVCVDPGHVAFVAVRDGNVRIGDSVAVFGLGAIGLLAVQVARAGGAQVVFAIDPVAARREFALAHGATGAFDPTACDAALEIKLATGKKGVDVAIETSGNGRALHEAIRCLRQCGTVVHVPWGPKDAGQLHLNEEFHLNRPTIIGSQAVWDNADRSHPLWNQERAFRAVTDLFANGTLTAHGLVSPIVPFEETPAAMGRLMFDPQAAIKTGVRFG